MASIDRQRAPGTDRHESGVGLDDPAQILKRALDGEATAMAELVEMLTPVIQARVVRTLMLRQPRLPIEQARQRVEDMTQEVFLSLFDDGSRVIRTWDSGKGLSLLNFVGLVAERKVSDILGSPKSNPWTEEPRQSQSLDRRSSGSSPEVETQSKQRLKMVLRRFKSELSPLGWQLFELLFLRELSVEEIARVTQMSADAIYAWRSRLRRLARRISAEQDRPRGSLGRLSHG